MDEYQKRVLSHGCMKSLTYGKQRRCLRRATGRGTVCSPTPPMMRTSAILAPGRSVCIYRTYLYTALPIGFYCQPAALVPDSSGQSTPRFGTQKSAPTLFNYTLTSHQVPISCPCPRSLFQSLGFAKCNFSIEILR